MLPTVGQSSIKQLQHIIVCRFSFAGWVWNIEKHQNSKLNPRMISRSSINTSASRTDFSSEKQHRVIYRYCLCKWRIELIFYSSTVQIRKLQYLCIWGKIKNWWHKLDSDDVVTHALILWEMESHSSHWLLSACCMSL